jgi:uncharacterized protein
MKLDLRGLGPEGKTFEGEEPASILGLEEIRDIRASSPIRYRVTACIVDHELIVRGWAATAVTLQCSRCAEFYDLPLPRVAVQYAGEVEAGSESADLTQELRETILVAFPSYPVCREQCKGLCVHCGANFNVTTCRCRPPAESRWDMLDGVNLDR